jgi:uncharacterized protein with PIN domain
VSGGEVLVRFYAELNDFLPPDRRFRDVPVDARAPRSVKDLVESLGVPHTEIDVILVNGISVDFAHAVAPGDRVSVYPVFEALDVTPMLRLRPKPLRETRFVLDVHLGKLAAYLRLLGFDARFSRDADDAALASVSRAERRILLTRDRGLLKRSEVTHGYAVRSTRPEEQLREVVDRFDLARSAAPFTRCLRCGGLLEPVAKAGVAARMPPRARELHDEVFRCPACDKLYWKGTHWVRMRGLVARALGARTP